MLLQKTQITYIARRSSYEKSRNVGHQRCSSATSSSNTPRASLNNIQRRRSNPEITNDASTSNTNRLPEKTNPTYEHIKIEILNGPLDT